MAISKKSQSVIWLVFIVLFLFTIGFMVATLSTSKWVELNSTSGSFSYKHPQVPILLQNISAPAYSFKGSLVFLEEGLSKVNTYLNPVPTASIDQEGHTYLEVGCGYCFIIDVSTQATFDANLWAFYKSWCNLMTNLWFSAGFFICLEVISLCCVVALIILSALFIKGDNHPRLSYFFANCLWVSHYLAILVWVGVINPSFNDSCSGLYNSDYSQPQVCATVGPKIGIFVLVFLPFLLIPFHVFVWYCCKHSTGQKVKDSPKENKSKQEVHKDLD